MTRKRTAGGVINISHEQKTDVPPSPISNSLPSPSTPSPASSPPSPPVPSKSLGNIAVLASGSGSDFQSIVDGIESGYVPGQIRLLICNKKEAFCLERAKKHNILGVYIDHRKKKREEFE